MPLYSFTTAESGDTIERFYPMGKAPRVVRVGGKRFRRDVAADWRRRKRPRQIHPYPHFSDALGCHPQQIPEMQATYAAQGVNLDFAPDGQAIIENRSHHKRVMRAAGVHEKNAYS